MSRAQLLSAFSNWLAFAAALAVAFGLTPFLVSRLGTARYDVWCVAEAILAWFTLLDMGLAACLVRGVARHHATRDGSSLNRMASSCLALFAAAGLIAVLIGLPVMLAVAPRLGRNLGDESDVLAFLVFLLVNVALTLPLSVFPSILDGLERYTAKSIVRIAFLALRTTAIVIAMYRDASLLPLAIVMTASNILEHAVMALLAFRFLPSLQLARRLVDRATLREVRGFSIDAFLAMFAGRITVQTGVILIGLLLPGGQVTIFATAARFVEYAKTLLRTLTATLTPGVSAMEARGDGAGIRTLFLTATRWVLYLALPIKLGLILFGSPFLVRWVPEVGDAATPALVILSMTLTLAVAQSVASRMLYGLGKLRYFARLALAEAGINAILLAALIGPLGIVGVAIATAVPNLIFCVFVIRHALRVVELNWSIYLRAWRTPLLASCVPAVIWLLRDVQPDWASLALHVLTGLIPYGVTVLLLEVRLPIPGRVRFGRRTPQSTCRR